MGLGESLGIRGSPGIGAVQEQGVSWDRGESPRIRAVRDRGVPWDWGCAGSGGALGSEGPWDRGCVGSGGSPGSGAVWDRGVPWDQG